MSTLLAIDPGNIDSAWLILRDGVIHDFGKQPNDAVLSMCEDPPEQVEHLAIEMVQSFGMPVGAEVFATIFWTGRFVQAFPKPHTLLYRKEVTLNICHSARAGDGNIRQALIDRFGGKDKAIGGVKCKRCQGKGWAGRGRAVCPACGGNAWLHPPGPLATVTKDVWSALAIALTWADQHQLAEAV